MLDLFTIFSKGGIVLWCFQGTDQIFTASVNALIRNVILQERTGINTFDHDGLSLQYKLDNEFDLVFVVGYQKILQLSYVDKFLNDIHLEYRDKYKNELTNGQYFDGFNFMDTYNNTLQKAEEWSKLQAKQPKQMRTFEESLKSKKTVSSMIERKGDEKPVKNVKKKEVNFATEEETISPPQFSKSVENGILDEETLAANRAKLAKKMQKKKTEVKKIPKSPPSQKAGKKPRVWDLGGTNKDLQSLERTTDKIEDIKSNFTPDTETVEGYPKNHVKKDNFITNTVI